MAKNFFGKRTYLTVSSQLHLEARVLGAKRDGYCMTTAFHAESSKSPMHLAEFLMPVFIILKIYKNFIEHMV
jgi:asparaginyl-tRNA synthetase